MDVSWINISGDAPNFETADATLLDRSREFNKPLYRSGPQSRFTLEVNCLISDQDTLIYRRIKEKEDEISPDFEGLSKK